MTRKTDRRLEDIEAALNAIGQHLRRGDLDDSLVFDAVRVRLIEIGEAVKTLPASLLEKEPDLPWREIARMRDFLAHRYFDSAHSIIRATIEEDLPALRVAVERLRKASARTVRDS